jgi:hypothetical protein
MLFSFLVRPLGMQQLLVEPGRHSGSSSSSQGRRGKLRWSAGGRQAGSSSRSSSGGSDNETTCGVLQSRRLQSSSWERKAVLLRIAAASRGCAVLCLEKICLPKDPMQHCSFDL